MNKKFMLLGSLFLVLVLVIGGYFIYRSISEKVSREPASFTNEVEYTKGMLKEDVDLAISKYEKLSPQEKENTVPMAIYDKRYHNSKEAEYILIAVGEGKSLDQSMANTKAMMYCRSNLIGQFVAKRAKSLTQGYYKVSMQVNMVDSGSYHNKKYNLLGETYSEEKTEHGQEIIVCKVVCSTPLKYYVSGSTKDSLATVYY